MAPMTRARNPDGIPNALNVLYHSQRASAGPIVTEGTPISRTARHSGRTGVADAL
jgi:2,4-dienoyl-CoA reductase-like NADH-dependent reductase (Old Yellow Enzyme family)